MATFAGYFEVLVNFNVENRREKFLILISILVCDLQNTN